MPDHVTQRPGPGPDWGRWVLAAGLALHWLLLRRRWALALALGGLCLLPASLGQAYHCWHDPQPHTIRDISRALGLAAGQARVFGPYEYSLYNRTENCYVGNWRGQAKPGGWSLTLLRLERKP